MSLLTLPKIVQKSSRRVGRGFGSNKGGHTTGRGAKGDKVRGSTRLAFDGTKNKKSWIQRLPKLRGKNKLKSHSSRIVTLNLSDLDKWFKAGETVSTETLSKKTGISAKFKVLSNGELKKALKLKAIAISSQALDKIKSAGGNIEE